MRDMHRRQTSMRNPRAGSGIRHVASIVPGMCRILPACLLGTGLLMAIAALPSRCSAAAPPKKANTSELWEKSQRATAGKGLSDPLNGQAHMRRLAGKFESAEASRLIVKGIDGRSAVNPPIPARQPNPRVFVSSARRSEQPHGPGTPTIGALEVKTPPKGGAAEPRIPLEGGTPLRSNLTAALDTGFGKTIQKSNPRAGLPAGAEDRAPPPMPLLAGLARQNNFAVSSAVPPTGPGGQIETVLPAKEMIDVTTRDRRKPKEAVIPSTGLRAPESAPALGQDGFRQIQVRPKRPNAQAPANPSRVWNGLSPSNRAAHKALRAMEAQEALRREAALPGPTISDPSSPAASRPSDAPAEGGRTSAVPPPIGQKLVMAKPGLVLWDERQPSSRPALLLEALAADVETPWSLGEDLDKYRAYAVREGSRDSGQSLAKALRRAGLAVEDGANVFLLGYGSERAEQFRGNDGKGILDDPGKVPQQAGVTLGSFGEGLYSVADLIALDSLPNGTDDAYQDNHPLVRPLVFTGRTIGGVWKTAEEVGNAVTWGYFDNVTGCIGLCIENIIEVVKHAGEAVTNVARLPVRLIAGQDEGAERMMDWVLLVPLEFATNSVQMKGIANMDDYETAFADKGVIGSVLELGGSTYIVYRATEELLDELDEASGERNGGLAGDAPTDSGPGSTPTPDVPVSTDIVFFWDGEWPTAPVGQF